MKPKGEISGDHVSGSEPKVRRLWGGRFEEVPPQEIVHFLSGRDVKGTAACDERLVPYDLWGSRAHVLMLCRQGILSKEDGKKLLRGLREIERLHEKGDFRLDPAQEDVHSCIENDLIQRFGMEFGGKIHTGRSRNDQIVLDMFLYLRDQALGFSEGLISLLDILVRKAEAHRAAIMPGYTHHQNAVPTTFGHLLLSFGEAFQRDVQRFVHWLVLFNQNPLGAAAGYGTSFDLDRGLTSRLLGCEGPTENVTDPITQRWEPELELAHAVAVTLNHVSALAQTLILLSTAEFHMVRLSDRHCSGSSIMPQKRNPDTLEVMKAKAAFAHGIVVSLLSTGKALFAGYNRETQWTKYWIMDLVEEARPVLPVMGEVVRLLQVDEARMLEQARKEFLGSTPLMEWIVRSFSLPMRQVKRVIEKAVRYSEEGGGEEVTERALKRSLKEMGIDLPISEGEVRKAQQPQSIISRLPSIGTPSGKRVKENIASLTERIKADRDWLARKRGDLEKGKRLLLKMEKALALPRPHRGKREREE